MDKKNQPPHHKIGLGGVALGSLGLGDAIKRGTAAVGIKPCKACRKRAEKLNQLFPFRQGRRG